MNFLNIGPPEMILILVLALIIFGPGKLPEIGRAVGKSIGEFRRATGDLTREISDSVNEVKQPFDEVRELATGTVGAKGAKVETVSCPACSVGNLATSKFCRECGARLVQEEATVNCPQCNVANPASNKFCRECGTALPAPSEPPAEHVTEATADTVPETAAESTDAAATDAIVAQATEEQEAPSPEAEIPYIGPAAEEAKEGSPEGTENDTEDKRSEEAVPEGATPR